jgi:23S rRNA pseudouridine2605 synthase
MAHRAPKGPAPAIGQHGLARVMSKLGVCSRTRAASLIREGRVTVNGLVARDPERRTDAQRDCIAIDGENIATMERVYLALNKPRGLIVSTQDEHSRDTVYALLTSSGLPWIAPIGRLDKASEGLLLMSNDTQWAARILAPARHVHKTYHVQVAGLPDEFALASMRAGVKDGEECLSAVEARVLRRGVTNTWLEVVLDEGRNRHLRRLLGVLGYDVLRLVRVSIGTLQLGTLKKGEWRRLTLEEVQAFGS